MRARVSLRQRFRGNWPWLSREQPDDRRGRRRGETKPPLWISVSFAWCSRPGRESSRAKASERARVLRHRRPSTTPTTPLPTLFSFSLSHSLICPPLPSPWLWPHTGKNALRSFSLGFHSVPLLVSSPTTCFWTPLYRLPVDCVPIAMVIPPTLSWRHMRTDNQRGISTDSLACNSRLSFGRKKLKTFRIGATKITVGKGDFLRV